VRNQGTLAGKEGDGDLDGLPVPVLGVPPGVDLLAQHFLQLVQEPVLGAHAEVGDHQEAYLKMRRETYFFQHVFAGELHFQRGTGLEVLHGKGSDLHDVSYVQGEKPLGLVQVAKQVLHVCVCFFGIFLIIRLVRVLVSFDRV